MNDLHDCSCFGVPTWRRCGFRTFGFLIQMTLNEQLRTSHTALCFHICACEVSSRALGQGAKFFTPRSFGSFSLAWGFLVPVDIAPERGVVGDGQSGKNV